MDWKIFIVFILVFRLYTCQQYLSCKNEKLNDAGCTIEGIVELKPFQYGGFIRTNSYGQRYHGCPSQITFSECEINFIPSKLFESCPQITHFDMSLSSVKYVSEYVFSGIQNLLDLKMSYNEIKELHDYTFMYGINLLHLDFSANELTKITNNTFNGLIKLLTLDLSINQIAVIEADSFKLLTNLQEIHLYDNHILQIDRIIFNENPLILLDLADNQLQEFVFISKFRNSLKKIDLSNNLLFEFNEFLNSDRILLNNNFLTSLNLIGTTKDVEASNNQISSIYLNNGIEKLKLSNNSISDISNLTYLTSLKILDLSFNNISTIFDSSFSFLEKLEQLILGNSKLQSFHFSTFSHQKMLKKFDISYNNLEEVNLDDFISMQNLEELYIDGNDLKEIKYSEISNNFPNLTIIGLSNNNWNCSYLTKMRKTIFSNKIEIHIDRNMYARNTTNIGGISCSDDKDTQEIIKNTIWSNFSTPISKHSSVDERSDQLNLKINLLMNELNKLQDKDKILVAKLLDMEKKLLEKAKTQITTTSPPQFPDLIIEDKNLTNAQLTALIDEVKKLSSNVKENRGNSSSSGVLLVFLIVGISSILVVYGVHLYMKKRDIKILSLSRTPILDNNL